MNQRISKLSSILLGLIAVIYPDFENATMLQSHAKNKTVNCVCVCVRVALVASDLLPFI